MKDNLKEIEISKETKRFLDDLYYLKDKEKEVKTAGEIFYPEHEQPNYTGDLYQPVFSEKINDKELKDTTGHYHAPWFYKLSQFPPKFPSKLSYKLPYTDEIIEFEGKTYKVIDTAKLEFLTAKVGVKSKLTKVYCAKGGEKIETTNEKGEVESVVVAEKGDAIFYNNEHDQYIPAGEDGKHWKYSEIESHGYSIQEHNDEENYVVVRSNNKALLLVGCVEENSAIKNAFGDGKPQYLYEGATIKKDIKTCNISGIDRAAFENTWEILPEAEARVELYNYMKESFKKSLEKYDKKMSKVEKEKIKKYLEDTWNE